MHRLTTLLFLVAEGCVPLHSGASPQVPAESPTACERRFGELLPPVMDAFHRPADGRLLLIDQEALQALGTINCARPVRAEHLTAGLGRAFRPALYRDIARSLPDGEVHVRLTSVVDLGARIEVVGNRLQRRSAERMDITQLRVVLEREGSRYKVVAVETLLET